MDIITRQTMAEGAFEEWSEAYLENPDFSPDKEHKVIAEKLQKLGKEVTPEKVNKIIGNDSWTSLCCDECNKNTNLALSVETSDSSYLTICSDCITKAHDMLKKATNILDNKKGNI